MTDNRPEPRTEAGRRMLRRRSYWSGNNAIREAILAIEAEASAAPQEGAAPRPWKAAEWEAASHRWENHDDSCECHIGICMECGCTNEYATPSEGAAPRAEGLPLEPDVAWQGTEEYNQLRADDHEPCDRCYERGWKAGAAPPSRRAAT